MRVYLASRSPRRRELLSQIGVVFDTLLFRSGPRADAEVDETPLPGEAVSLYVERIARAKAGHARQLVSWRHLLPQAILAADTVLEVDGEIIGKPASLTAAADILSRLSGRAHRVLTGVCLSWPEADSSREDFALSVSTVHFRTLEDDEIRRYVHTGEPMDKAGAYGIQGRAGLFVRRLEGSYSGVMGLPLCETGSLLRTAGFVL